MEFEEYEWDEKKNLSNIDKHGFAFSLAAKVFNGKCITRLDRRRNYGEERLLTLGSLEEGGRKIMITYTSRNGKKRIISMRKANLKELKTFYMDTEHEHA